MPHLNINTNIKLSKDEEESLLQDATQLIVDELGKHKNYVMTSINADTSMLFGGTNDPLAYVRLESIGFSKELSEISNSICSFLGSKLDIPADRIYIKFDDVARESYGWNNTTFG